MANAIFSFKIPSMGGKKKGKKRRAKKGRGKHRRRSAATATAGKRDGCGINPTTDGIEHGECAASVQRVFSKVNLAEKIMEFYFDDSPERGADVSPFGMTSVYWLSCHDHFVGKHADRLVRAWFEECCDATGVFELHRSQRGKDFYTMLKHDYLHHEWISKLLTGTSAVCFSNRNDHVSGESKIASNINVMALLQIISEDRLKCCGVALSTARHLMAQWMYMSIGDWRAEMKHPEKFKQNLVEMCSSLKKASLGGCRPAAKAFIRGRMLFELAVAFERKDVNKVRRIVRLLN